MTATEDPHPRKLGRRPRIFSPLIPHLSSMLGALEALPVPSPEVDYLKKAAPDYGMMGNDTLGDCVIASLYHARQVWSANAGVAEITEPDVEVIGTYEAFCGYDPRRPQSDQGCVEQQVLAHWVVQGMPIVAAKATKGKSWGGGGDHHHRPPHPPHPPGPTGPTDKLLAFVEVDPRNDADIQVAIEQCGVVLIGFNVPESIVPPGVPSPELWDVVPGSKIVGGHAVILGAYSQAKQTYGLVSWGKRHDMTKLFKDTYVDEIYALADASWIGATGQTILGLTIVQLEALMLGVKKTKSLLRV
jgi:hypothetical protein